MNQAEKEAIISNARAEVSKEVASTKAKIDADIAAAQAKAKADVDAQIAAALHPERFEAPEQLQHVNLLPASLVP